MLAKLIQSLFPEGQRKVMVSLIAIAVGTILEKFAGGLSDHMMTLLIAGVGIFTTGNVIQGVTDAIKGTKVGQIIEDILPGDQGLGSVQVLAGRPNAGVVAGAQAANAQAQQAISAEHVYQAANQVVGGAMESVGKRFQELENKLTVQAQNQAKLVEFINKLTAQQRPTPQPAPRPAQPARDEDDE